jgi:hypothetical protein
MRTGEDEAMTEAEWEGGTDPLPMLTFLKGAKRLTARKARLFVCACCRRIWPLLGEEGSRKAVEVAERFADGLATSNQLLRANRQAGAVSKAARAAGVG